jgi:hypothetical protein
MRKDKTMSLLRKGTRVRATRRIVENDTEPDKTASPCEGGWVHALPGDVGTVEDETVTVDGLEFPTVRFDRTRTATAVFLYEIEVISETQ